MPCTKHQAPFPTGKVVSALEWRLARNARAGVSAGAGIPRLMHPSMDDGAFARDIAAAADETARASDLLDRSGFGQWPDPRADMPGFLTAFVAYLKRAYELCGIESYKLGDGTLEDLFRIVEMGVKDPLYYGGFRSDADLESFGSVFQGFPYLCLLVGLAQQDDDARELALCECYEETRGDWMRGDDSDPDILDLIDLIILLAPRGLSLAKYLARAAAYGQSRWEASLQWRADRVATVSSRAFVNRIRNGATLPRWMPSWPFER